VAPLLLPRDLDTRVAGLTKVPQRLAGATMRHGSFSGRRSVSLRLLSRLRAAFVWVDVEDERFRLS
jgi:hypothetical protein